MELDSPHRLITTQQMYAADQQTIDAGISEKQLIANAAARVCAEIITRYDKCPVLVLAGPGNNGADGLMAAEILMGEGWPVTIWKYTKDKVQPDLSGVGLIVDALFGAGLSKPLGGVLQELVSQVNQCAANVLSIDIPTGIDGNTGHARPTAIQADLTVTFFRQKPGHVLYPGRAHAGEIVCKEIDISAQTLNDVGAPTLYENHPDLWRKDFSKRTTDSHKYKHGHVLTVSGPMRTTGAARLAARGALRAGAGLVSIAAPASALMVHAVHLTAIMLEKCNEGADLTTLAEDKRKNVILVGPGLGVNKRGRDIVQAALACPAALILDADALTLYRHDPHILFKAIKDRKAPVILTPHGGEFSRLFGSLADMPKIEVTMQAAKISGATIAYKGPDTVIATHGQECVINSTASPHLATAGSGDVLAGIIAGLFAQGMEPLKAACAGVWLHGTAGLELGPGLIAGDIPPVLPKLLKQTFYSD